MSTTTPVLITDEIDLLQSLVDLDAHPRIIELGCGAAQLSRNLLNRFPACEVTGLEVDERQHAKNLLKPQQGLHFLQAGAQAIPFADGQFDLALMLKSLHHVPMDLLDQALHEVRRVLRPQGLLYVSEPVFAGPLNEVMRLFHDEELVRAAALRAVQAAVASGHWEQVSETHFEMPVYYRDFADFEQRMIGVTFVTHSLDASTLAAVRARFEPNMGADGAHFVRPMRVNLLRKL
ncbi:MAG: class I SAM-dependent methyltransferase [Gammaproteobacteria bacterium]|nr:class I SAM-dependent methyltransferase [Gammaproteobacteria bacterium]MBU0788401.1 class I SAM-dependent methyltransferase [Gammaproteobacteria bacterium]MBU0815742.1 class I SAM-dependent methyltransferase [Gammaproteobacteria bacterium]MBU1788249.1 class I SAM-dependent methyltransferase [Gammaproteobacteria bacterium]